MSKESKTNWESTILASHSTIREVIYSLDASGLRIVLVVDKDGKFLGTVSDGDVRRGILKGYNLDVNIIEITNRNSIVASVKDDRKRIAELMMRNKIHQIPVVDSHNKLIGLKLWNEISATKSLENMMVIMAGGRGTRLHPYTENCPKPLLEVNGKPILTHIIEGAKNEGISNFLISINYLGEMIQDFFKDGTELGVNIDYIREENPLGTAGALGLIEKRPDQTFLVTNGDLLVDIRYSELIEFHENQDAMGTMAIRAHEWQNPFGVVKTDGIFITDYFEKPKIQSYINAGVYVLDPKVLNKIEPGVRIDMPEIFERMLNANERVIAYPLHEPWRDIGRVDDLKEANAITDLALGREKN
jgi:dTDP-glucose pyrophosphorylase/predicted transcriptional regulator